MKSTPSSSRTPRAAASHFLLATALCAVACSKHSAPAPTEATAIEAAAARVEKTARIERAVRDALANKPTLGEGASPPARKADEARRLKDIRAAMQPALEAAVAEVGALGARVTLLRPRPENPKLADAEKETIATLVVPPCIPESPKLLTAKPAGQWIDYGLFRSQWADDAGTYGDTRLHPGVAVTRRMFFGAGQEVPLEKSAVHVAADVEAVIVACYLTDGTPRPAPAR